MARDAQTGRRWRRWSEGEAQAALAELERSGESDVEFARRRGVSTQRLRYWRKRLDGTRSLAFVAVRIPETKDTAEEIAIRVDGIAVCVREDFDVEQLARIVGALALARRSRAC